ncbi:MAG: 3-dehydroquinate synthase [Fimbriimonadales bacterium]|nr:3-dehydroquinate synthase [Fimbriimonadales bacterium]
MKHLYLVGMMGSGKSVVGRRVAERLALPYYDLDALIEQQVGASVAQIFERGGETAFRAYEQAALRRVADAPAGVVATGGGAVLSEANRALMRRTGWVVYLKAAPDVLWRRLRHTANRPLLQTPAPRDTLEQILQTRAPLYEEADWIVETDALTPEQVAEQVLRAARPSPEQPIVVRVLPCQPTEYLVAIAPALHTYAAERILALRRPSQITLLTHRRLLRWAEPVRDALERAGVPVNLVALSSGERIKSLRTAERLYAHLLRGGLDRSGLIVIMGGGVLGDLGGFVAATYMRGVPYVQIPTTLLAQVDSSVGGKVAVDLPQGKNLVGAFHQPALTLVDPEILHTLPARHWRNGFAEMLKYGVVLHRGLWLRLQTMLEQGVLTARRVRRAAACWTLPIARCVQLKAQIVSDDERDLSGRRALLNFGHTVGHAIEAALGYRGWLHGEAIAAGMVAEAELGQILGVTPREVVDELTQTLAQARLPTRLPAGVSAATLQAAMRHDKKRAGGALAVVLLKQIGNAQLEPNIPDDALREALRRCGAS